MGDRQRSEEKRSILDPMYDNKNNVAYEQSSMMLVNGNSWELRKFLEYENILSFRKKWEDRHRDRLFARVVLQGWLRLTARQPRPAPRMRHNLRGSSSSEEGSSNEKESYDVKDGYSGCRLNMCQRSLTQYKERLLRAFESSTRKKRKKHSLQGWKVVCFETFKVQEWEERQMSRQKQTTESALREWRSRRDDANKRMEAERTREMKGEMEATGYVKDLMEVEERCHSIRKVQQQVQQLQDSISKSRSLSLEKEDTRSRDSHPAALESFDPAKRSLLDKFQSVCSNGLPPSLSSPARASRSNESLELVPQRRQRPRGLPEGIEGLLQ
eukprot:753154-Hanusia_phi.AAC.10